MSKTKQTAKGNDATFFRAAAKGDVARLQTLLGAGQKVDVRDETGRTALMSAAECGRLDAARVLLGSGADATASVSDRDSVWFGCNAVIFAAQRGIAELVELLLEAGASPKCVAANGTTPLGLAVEHQSRGMVKALLKAGAPPNVDSLVTSVWNGTEELSLLLIEAGANASACDDLGQSVLHQPLRFSIIAWSRATPSSCNSN
jgi:ankyrin repeat protein